MGNGMIDRTLSHRPPPRHAIHTCARRPIILPLLDKYGAKMTAADSEHSAIFQCLQGVPPGALRRVILTASGGAFRDFEAAELLAKNAGVCACRGCTPILCAAPARRGHARCVVARPPFRAAPASRRAEVLAPRARPVGCSAECAPLRCVQPTPNGCVRRRQRTRTGTWVPKSPSTPRR